MRHEGKAIIVTGAAGAIGFATAEILYREGAELALVDVDEAGLRTRMEQLAGMRDPNRRQTVISLMADVSDEAATQSYAKAAMDTFGKIDGFFNNAGIEGKLAPTHEYDVEEFDKVLRVNLRGMFLGLRYVLPHMVAAG